MRFAHRSSPLRHTGLALACLALPLAQQARAQASSPASGEATGQETGSASVHPEDRATAIVVAGRVVSGSRDPTYAPVVLQDDALLRQMRPQIGQMLERLPGVSASGFAPGASRPVLRGFDGPRVQILRDGLGSLDAATVSADHAVSLDTLTIERVEVLHGPRVLLYASDPSGGVVNAIDRRIPRAVPETTATLDALATYGSAADSVIAGAAADIRIARRLVAHVDGGYSRSSNLRVGGAVISPHLRADLLADAAAHRAAGEFDEADELAEQANARTRIANSWARQWTLGGGLAFIDDGGDIGVSVQQLASDYGVPPRPAGHDSGHHHGHNNVSIELRQTRFDMRAGLAMDGFLDRLTFRGAYGDYRHVELDDGEPAARFDNTAIEARLEAIQATRGVWSGTSGVQYGSRRLDVRGEEALLPDSLTERFAAFTLQRMRFGAIDVELAGRAGRTLVKARSQPLSRRFNHWSGTAGVAWHASNSLNLTLSLSRSERAPSSEELFTDGIHEAAQSYERGNPDFRTERNTGLEAGLHYTTSRLLLAVTGYATRFRDFIASVPTGERIEGLPAYQFLQTRARFHGFEAEGSATLANWGERSLKLDAAADYTHGRLPGIGPVPRIPPFRARSGVELDSPGLTLRGEVEWNARQERVAASEFPVRSFTLLNASAIWRPWGKDGPLTLILSGDNLLDSIGRRAASVTRDFVPIAGRDLRLTIAMGF